jgi:hypothetical protein
VFYRWAQPRWLPRTAESRIYNEFFVAVDDGIVRGGYALKTQDFFFPDGQIRSIGYYHHPLSEGIVNKSHAMVGTLLLRDAMQRAPLLYCLGMGGYDRPLPQMLIRLGWADTFDGSRGIHGRRMGWLEAVPELSRSTSSRVA